MLTSLFILDGLRLDHKGMRHQHSGRENMDAMYHTRFANHQCSMSRGGQVPDDDEPDEMNGSVGENGQNRSDDVQLVQKLLNGVEPGAGGPDPPLDEDGICGKHTKDAIWKFQRRWTDLVQKDGRVDPDKNTWKKLVVLSQGTL